MQRKELVALVEKHTAYLSGDRIVAEVENVPTEFRQTLEYRFLQAVVFYHRQHKATVKDWETAFGKFQLLVREADETWSVLKFYIYNYCFLSGRNANRAWEELTPLYSLATGAAHEVEDEATKNQLLGFFIYNWARYLHKIEEVKAARSRYNEAAIYRRRYYEQLKAEGNASEEEIRSAATQVWKMRADWQEFFPEDPIDNCAIGAELFAEVERLADKKFSAARK